MFAVREEVESLRSKILELETTVWSFTQIGINMLVLIIKISIKIRKTTNYYMHFDLQFRIVLNSIKIEELYSFYKETKYLR